MNRALGGTIIYASLFALAVFVGQWIPDVKDDGGESATAFCVVVAALVIFGLIGACIATNGDNE